MPPTAWMKRLTAARRDKVMGDLLRMAPSLSEAELVQQTACQRPLSHDGYAIVGERTLAGKTCIWQPVVVEREYYGVPECAKAWRT